MNNYYLTNCRLILTDETVEDGSIAIAGEEIVAVCPERTTNDFRELDLRGATVMPGMVDVHSDAIESLAEPRSGIYLPFELAAQQADNLAAINGITTFFNAISFAGEELGLRQHDAPARLVQAICNHRQFAGTDQRVHCRLEVMCAGALPQILAFLQDGSCDFVSYMDHSPGQGQFQDEANYRSYMSARYGYTDETITQLLESKTDLARAPDLIHDRVRQLASVAAECSVPLAGHDPDSKAVVDEMVKLGAVLAEFPMSAEAARASAEVGLHQSVGSVNVIRGGSQRTGMSAMHLIELGQADCLCSDYVPGTLLPAVWKIATELGRPLHEVACLVTSNPARAAGLHDRGAIQAGMKADLVAFERLPGQSVPSVQATWAHGQIVYARSGLI